MPDSSEHAFLVRQYRPQLQRETLEVASELVMAGEIIDVNSRPAIMLAAEHVRRYGLTDAS